MLINCAKVYSFVIACMHFYNLERKMQHHKSIIYIEITVVTYIELEMVVLVMVC